MAVGHFVDLAHLRDAFGQRFADGGFCAWADRPRANGRSQQGVGMSFIANRVKSYWLAAAPVRCAMARRRLLSECAGVNGSHGWRTIQF